MFSSTGGGPGHLPEAHPHPEQAAVQPQGNHGHVSGEGGASYLGGM